MFRWFIPHQDSAQKQQSLTNGQKALRLWWLSWTLSSEGTLNVPFIYPPLLFSLPVSRHPSPTLSTFLIASVELCSLFLPRILLSLYLSASSLISLLIYFCFLLFCFLSTLACFSAVGETNEVEWVNGDWTELSLLSLLFLCQNILYLLSILYSLHSFKSFL